MNRSIVSLLALLVALALSSACNQPAGNLDDDDSAVAEDDDDVVDDDDVADDDDGADDDDSVDDDDDDVVADASVDAVHPADGVTDHFVTELLWVDFDVVAPDAVVTLADGAGVDVPGAGMWVSANRYTFDPTDSLAFGTHYVATVTWSVAAGEATHSWEFDTSNEGDTATGADLVGSTFAFDLNAGEVVAPPGGEMLLGQFTGVLMTGILGQTATELDVIAAVDIDGGNPPEQDLCMESVSLDDEQPTLWLDPFFLAGPADIPQSFDFGMGDPIEILFRDVMVSGMFAASTAGGAVDSVAEGTFTTIIDLRDAGLDCATAAFILPDLVCVECPHDATSSECVAFIVIDLPATLVPGLSLVEVTAQDIDDNPACE